MFQLLHSEAQTLTKSSAAFALGLQRFNFYLQHLEKSIEDIHEHAEDLNREHEQKNTDQAQLEEIIQALQDKHSDEQAKKVPDSNTLTKLGLAEHRLRSGHVFDSCELLVKDALGLLTDSPGPEFLKLYKQGGPDKVKFSFVFV